MTEIDKNLFIGGLLEASDSAFIVKNKIKAILTLANAENISFIHQNLIPDIERLEIQVLDSFDSDLLSHLPECIEFIERCIINGSVLVHCYAGVSRSSTVIIAYIMKKFKYDVREALSFVRNNRRIVCPNEGFMRQLQFFHEMNCHLDLSNKKLALYFLQFLSMNLDYDVENVKYLNLILACLERLEKEQVFIRYKCKKCRKELFNNNHEIKPDQSFYQASAHQQQDQYKQSTMTEACINIIPPYWIIKQQLSKPDGKVACYKCEMNVGRFQWKAKPYPLFSMTCSKIDMVAMTPIMQSPNPLCIENIQSAMDL